MSLSDVMLCCPHCRREYRVSIDLGKLARVTSRAACARCKKIFEITPDRMRGLEAARRPHDSGRPAAFDARRDVRVDRTSRPPPLPSDAARDDVPAEAVRAASGTSLGRVEERSRGRSRAPENVQASEPSPLAMPRTLSARLIPRTVTPRTRSRDAIAAPPSRTRSQDALAAPPPASRSADAIAAPPAPTPVVSDAPVVDPDSDWLLRADPGLTALTTAVPEGAAALQWLLEQ